MIPLAARAAPVSFSWKRYIAVKTVLRIINIAFKANYLFVIVYLTTLSVARLRSAELQDN